MSAIRIATLSLPAIILLLLAVAESSKLASAASMSGCQAGVRRGDVVGASGRGDTAAAPLGGRRVGRW